MNTIEQAQDALRTARHADLGSIVDRKLAEAQAAATVALAEQQRIANMIAWTSRDGYRPTDEVADQIVNGLGL